MKAKLNDITLGNWQVYRMNLTDAVMPYYIKVAASFSDTSKGAGKLIEEQRKRVSSMLGLLARMEGRGKTPMTRKELSQLEKLDVKFREVHKQVAAWVKESIPLQKGSEKAIKDLPISRGDKKVAAKMPRRPQKLGGLVHMLGLGRLTIAGGVAGLLAPIPSMLGPLAGPSMVGAGLLTGAGVGISRMVKRRRARRMGGAAAPGRRIPPGIAGGAMPGISPRVAGGAMPGIVGTGVAEGMPSTYPRDALGRFTKRGALTGINNIEKGLFKFFNARALKAKWTRRLLRAAEKGAGKKGVGRGGILDSFAKLKLLLPGLLLGLGKGAGLAGAAIFAGIQLYKAGKVAIEWYDVHKKVSVSIKKQTALQQKFLQNLSDTLMEKVRKAKAEGDEPARKAALEEVIKVEREKIAKEPKPGLWKSWKRGVGGLAGDVRKVPGFKDGAVVTEPTLGVLAEDHKPEVVTPLSSGSVMDVLNAIKKNTANAAGMMTAAPINTFLPPFDLADPLLNQLNTTGSLG